MSDLPAILRYFADLARVGVEPTRFYEHFLWLGRFGSAGDKPLRLDPGRMSHEATQLVARDRLHSEQQLLRQGWLWIEGLIDGVPHRVPMIVRRLAARSMARRLGDSILSLPMSLEPQGPWQINGQLLDDDGLIHLAGRDIDWPLGAAVSGGGSVERAFPRLAEFIYDYLRFAGLPTDLKLRDGLTPEQLSGPAVLVGTALYLDDEPMLLNRPSALRVWADEDPHQSALAALYAREPAALGLPEVDHVRSPLPLNPEQLRAIEETRRNELTVVSGPPGTGKTHMVAAAAVAEVASGGTVLIATQSRHACDVIEQMLDEVPQVTYVRFGDEVSARELGDELAAGVEASAEDEVEQARSDLDDLDGRIARERERLAAVLRRVQRFDDDLDRRDDLPLWFGLEGREAIDTHALRDACQRLDNNGLLGRRRARSARREIVELLGPRASSMARFEVETLADDIDAVRDVDEIAGRSLALERRWARLEQLHSERRDAIGRLLDLERRSLTGWQSLGALADLATALRVPPLERRRRLLDMGDRFLDAAPLWVGTLADIEAILPIAQRLFDLVILDEASQISQINAVPALARADRAMIVGDARQLRHVSFVSHDAQAAAAGRHDVPEGLSARLDDRTNSVFDAASAVAPVVQLDEHFRSAPHIIGFSNRRFYNGQLRLMTQHPANESRDAIHVVRVVGARDEAGVVQTEVGRVIELVREAMAAGIRSVGVVSPFRAQAEALEAMMLDTFTLEEIERHRLRVGTVHGFQGTERDVIFISLGLGPTDLGSLRHVEDPAVFNVMVTRARSEITLVTALGDDVGSGLLRDYLRHSEEPPMARAEVVEGRGWTERLARELAEGLDQRVITDYEVAGDTIDIVIGEGEDAVGLDTELHPGGPETHIERHMALRRAGWQIEDVFWASAFGREEEVIAGLLARFSRRTD